MNSFWVRFLSAIVAVFLMTGVFWIWRILGLKVLSSLVVSFAAFELVKILFQSSDSKLNRSLFFVLINCIFLLSSVYTNLAGLIFAFFSICFCLVSLLTQEKFKDLETLTRFQAKSVLGFFYVGLLPSFAVRMLDLNHGLWWFVSLLSVVFAGDIGGYVFGILFGKRKLMPVISPKKTVEGAIGGLVFSMCAAYLCWHQLQHISLVPFMLLCVGASTVALFGDLFESQLKRAAEVKDSGSIMPGHGGILDRIDGVLFASPIMMFGALMLEQGL